MLEKSSSTIMYMINDHIEVSSIFRSCSIPVHNVYIRDAPSHDNVLTTITEGGVMGIMVGLSGFGDPAQDSHKLRSFRKKPEGGSRQKRREDDTRNRSRLHAQLMEIMMTVLSCGGFVIMFASPRNDAWNYNFVRQLLGAFRDQLTILDVHSCRILGPEDTCVSIRVATTLSIDVEKYNTSHHASCSFSHADKKSKQLTIVKGHEQRSDDGGDLTVASDTKAKLRALGQELVKSTLLPIIRDLCSVSRNWNDTLCRVPLNQLTMV